MSLDPRLTPQLNHLRSFKASPMMDGVYEAAQSWQDWLGTDLEAVLLADSTVQQYRDTNTHWKGTQTGNNTYAFNCHSCTVNIHIHRVLTCIIENLTLHTVGI